ncbi:MAG: flagellar hook-basal body protein [Clostridia bacterium]|nr:flagellar hook-basal body protein [Clostridia bacterium]
MMRSLWTAASGMYAQQLSMDNIANNISNVNTYGYKSTRLEFKDLLYSNLTKATLNQNGEGSPVTLQVGSGVRSGSITRDFKTGNITTTSNNFDFAIEGNGFFCVQNAQGQERYTKDGTFKISPYEDANYLTTSEGYRVLNADGEPISFDANILTDSITCDTAGNFGYTDPATGNIQTLDMGLRIVQFTNVLGLESCGENLFQQTVASGEPIDENNLELGSKSVIRQSAIEASNVDVATEMVNMIVTQRAYELNSKAITTSDDMLAIANQLKN